MIEDFEDESCNPSIEPSIGVLMSRRALVIGQNGCRDEIVDAGLDDDDLWLQRNHVALKP